MARVNVGVNPINLTDQHLFAESVEITMITGFLKSQNFEIKGKRPNQFKLGGGHILFFTDKISYLEQRLNAVNEEIFRRGFRTTNKINIEEYPTELRGDWKPNVEDSRLIKERIQDRLQNPLKAKNGFHRFQSEPISNMNDFINELNHSELFHL